MDSPRRMFGRMMRGRSEFRLPDKNSLRRSLENR